MMEKKLEGILRKKIFVNYGLTNGITSVNFINNRRMP
jgi:hypothetical protein